MRVGNIYIYIYSESGELITENRKMADKSNRYFTSIFSVKDASNIPEIDGNHVCKGGTEENYHQRAVILSKLWELQAGMSPDSLHPGILQKVA